MRIFAVFMILVFGTGPALASEENYLEWSEIRLVSPPREDTGRVVFTAETSAGQWRSVRLEAFGKEYTLDDDDLAQLQGFPLSSIRTTYERGYPELNGHMVHFEFKRHRRQNDENVAEDIVLSVSERQGLRVGPLRRHTPREEYPSLK